LRTNFGYHGSELEGSKHRAFIKNKNNSFKSKAKLNRKKKQRRFNKKILICKSNLLKNFLFKFNKFFFSSDILTLNKAMSISAKRDAVLINYERFINFLAFKPKPFIKKQGGENKSLI